MSSPAPTTEVWRIIPRDPLVAGNGLQPYAFGVDVPHLLPPPSTLAGAVRAQFVQPGARLSRDEVNALLDAVRIRRAWLGDIEHGMPLLTPPADAEAFVDAKGQLIRVDRATVGVLGTGEGLWRAHDGAPSGLSLAPVTFPSHTSGEKSTPWSHLAPLWSWHATLAWAGGKAPSDADLKSHYAPEREVRVHVRIDNDTGTADPGALFSSRGRRYRGAALYLEVQSPCPRPDGMITVGGESRLSFLDAGPAFPTFADSEKPLFPPSAPALRGLRLQLLTPAWCDPTGKPGRTAGWLPSWITDDGTGTHPLAPGVTLRLTAIAMGEHMAISGWDMQARGGARGRGAPRAVRRLVPSGTVYFFEVLTGSVRDACKCLWGQPFEPSSVGPRSEQLVERHLAHPADDGFGTVLPTPWYDIAKESLI